MTKKMVVTFWIGLCLVILGALQILNFGFLSGIASSIISKIAPLVIFGLGVYLMFRNK